MFALTRLDFCSAAPAARMAMTRRVHPLVSLNPYQGNWTIKVRVTNKGVMRNYKNARGEGCVFNVELTDEEVRMLPVYFISQTWYRPLYGYSFCLFSCDPGNTNSSNDV